MKFFLLLSILFPLQLRAQMNVHVVDSETSEAVSNALIMVDSTIIGISDQHGSFYIDIIDSSFKLTVKCLGYETYSAVISHRAANLLIKLIPSSHQLSEVVVSNQLTNQKLRSLAGNYSMLTRSDLLRGNSVTIADYFNQLPGVFIQQGALNTNRLTIRGVGSRTPYVTNRIKAYFDEIPLTTGDGTTTLEDIDMAGISRVEVLKGPSSALYGAGLGGVVKYYPATQLSNNSVFAVQSQAASYGTFKNTLSSAFRQENYDVSVVLSHVYSDGYRQNSRYKRGAAFLFGNRYWKNSNVRVVLSLIGVNARIPSSIDQQTFDQNPQAAAKNWLAIKGYEDYTKTLGGLTWTNMLSNSLVSQTTVFMGSQDHYQSRPFNILWENSLDYGLRQKFTWTQRNHTWVAGVEWFNEDYTWKIYRTNQGSKGSLTSKNQENRNYTNLFALCTSTLYEKLVLEAGVNVNTLGYHITDEFDDAKDNSDHYRYKPVISPRVGLNYKVSSFANLYSSVGHGFSAPSLQETLLPEGQPNVNIKPEDGYTIDIGARFNLLDNRLYLDVTQYWMFLRNLLVTKRLSEDVFTGENAGSTNHHGIEITAKYSVLPEVSGSKNSVDLSLNFTNTDNHFKSFADTSGDYSGKKLPGVPFTSLNLNLSIKLQQVLHFYLDFQHIGKQYMTDNNTKSYHAYQLVGLKTAYRLTNQRGWQFSVYAGVQNLFNLRYASMILVNAPSLGTASPRYYYPGNPRNYYAGLIVTFGKR